MWPVSFQDLQEIRQKVIVNDVYQLTKGAITKWTQTLYFLMHILLSQQQYTGFVRESLQSQRWSMDDWQRFIWISLWATLSFYSRGWGGGEVGVSPGTQEGNRLCLLCLFCRRLCREPDPPLSLRSAREPLSPAGHAPVSWLLVQPSISVWHTCDLKK